MTSTELQTLDQTLTYHFTMYYGERRYGFAAQHDNEWYIVHPRDYTKNNDIAAVGFKVLPEQIMDCRPSDGNTNSNANHNSFSYDGSTSFKTLVVFGAGASHDYCYQKDLDGKPPLTCNLFCDKYSNLIEKFPGVENLSSQIQQAGDIETYFQRQWDKVFKQHNQQLLNKLIDVQYYLHYLFLGISSQPNYARNNYVAFLQFLYDHLIGKGPKEKAMIVTFNYDTLLEKSLERSHNYSFDSMDDYIDLSRRFIVFKPHGSCNWIRNIDVEFCKTLHPKGEPSMENLHRDIYRNQVSLGRLMQHLAEDITLLPPHNLWSNYYFPQLLIPYKTKDSFVMPETHTIAMETFLGQVDSIFIIGWKGAEEKFKKLLGEKLGNKKILVRYVNNKDDTIEKELRPVLPHAIFTEVAPFEDSIPTFTGLNKVMHEITEIFD